MGGYKLFHLCRLRCMHSKDFHLRYDVKQFETLYHECDQESPQAALGCWASMMSLYQQKYLYTLDMAWINKRREALSQHYLEALVSTAQYFEKQKQFREAIDWYRKGLVESPLREEFYQAILTILLRQKRYDEAITEFNAYRTLLAKTRMTVPSKQIQEVYHEILKAIGFH